MARKIGAARQAARLIVAVAVLGGLLLSGCGNSDGRNSAVAGDGSGNVAVQQGGNSKPSQMAGWPAIPEGSEPGLLEGGIIGDVLGRMPPAIGAADGLLQPGETADIKITLGRGLGSVQYRGYEGETIVVRDAHSNAVIHRGRTDKDGRLTFKRRFPQPGNYFFEAQAENEIDNVKVKPALFGIYVRPADAPFVIADMDLTLVQSGFTRVIIGMADPYDNASNVMSRLVKERDWSPIYLTQRPDYLEPMSKNWLRKHGFPPGPIVPTNLQTLIQGSGRFKTEAVRQLKGRFSDVQLAVGDKYSDAVAYSQNEVPSILIPPIDWNKRDAKYWNEQIQQLEQVGEEVQVVQDWHEIEQAVFGDKRFPPSTMLKMMRERVR